jgi:hypothetical protein
MEPGLKRVRLWIKSVALVATRLQQLQPLVQARMMNTPAKLFSLGINSTGMATPFQREKAQYRKDTKPRSQAKKSHPFGWFFFAPNTRDPRMTGAGERHLPDDLLPPAPRISDPILPILLVS